MRIKWKGTGLGFYKAQLAEITSIGGLNLVGRVKNWRLEWKETDCLSPPAELIFKFK